MGLSFARLASQSAADIAEREAKSLAAREARRKQEREEREAHEKQVRTSIVSVMHAQALRRPEPRPQPLRTGHSLVTPYA